jgi:ribosomal protein L13E
MFNLGKKDSQGRQKRIEHRGKYLRASRTGGVSLRTQMKAAGLTVTGNTKRGIRVSTRVAKGTNVAFQNGRFRLKGRYGKGATKLNLSKSGMSVSTKNALGTFNWSHPNRSSAKIAGIQMRGKKAANLQMVYLLFMLLVNLIKLSVLLLFWLFQALYLLGRALWIGAARGSRAAVEVSRTLRARLQAKKGEAKIAGAALEAELSTPATVEAALLYAVSTWGRGMSAEELAEAGERAGAEADGVKPHTLDQLIEPGKPRREARQMVQVTAALAQRYATRASREEIGETFLRLDEAARNGGPMTKLQEKLIDTYADTAHPLVEARQKDSPNHNQTLS